MEKKYERTGIKEHQIKRIKKKEVLKKEKHQKEMEISIKKGLKNYEKEYQKTKDILRDYRVCAKAFKPNTQVIITGYNEFFNSHEKMTISSLRILRRSIVDTISQSEDILTRARITEQQESMQRLREDKILDFYVEYYAKISESGLEKTLDTSLVSYLAEKQIYIRSESELSKAKEKVKSITKS